MLEQKSAGIVDDEEELARWAERYRAARQRRAPEGFLPLPETLSGLPVEPLYTPSAAVPKPANWRMVKSLSRYMESYTPRV